MEAIDAATHIKADLTYLDPPYNQHKYLGNTIFGRAWFYGINPRSTVSRASRSIVEPEKVSSNSNQFHQAMKDVIDALSSAYLVVSFNNEGYITPDMEEMLSKKGVANPNCRL